MNIASVIRYTRMLEFLVTATLMYRAGKEPMFRIRIFMREFDDLSKLSLFLLRTTARLAEDYRPNDLIMLGPLRARGLNLQAMANVCPIVDGR